MGWLEEYPRPYYSKYRRIRVKNDQQWYQVYELPRRVWAIAEPQQLQEVNCFLVPGRDAALLVDTGMGIRPLKPLIRELYEGPVLAVNTHAHFDHIGSNGQFEPVFAADTDYARYVAGRGVRYEDVESELQAECFQFGPPPGMKPEEYRVAPYEIRPVKDGHVFDLGDRTLRVIHTGGHCQDHLCLLEELHHILFTGDLAYQAALFANFDNPLFGTSDLARYSRELQRLVQTLPEDTMCCGSHNEFVLTIDQVRQIADAFREVEAREAAGEEGDHGEAGMGLEFGEKGCPPHIYEFDSFSIYTRGRD